MTGKKRIILTLLSLIGLALTIELCVVYYNSNFAINAKPSICAINDMMDCDGVARTAYSQFLGVPLSLWGLCLYLFFLFMTFVDKIQNVKFLGFLKVFKNPSSYIFCIGLLSFLISIVLGGISVFKIDAVCIFCFMTYIIDFLIALTAKSNSMTEEIKISINDFIEAIKVKKYAVSFVIIAALGIGTLYYTTTSNVLAPQIIRQNELKKSFNINIPVNGNRMGRDDAAVKIDEYMDFNCGGCYVAQLYIHRVMEEFENVEVIQHNVPLDPVCNPNMKNSGHKNSCLKASYALAAAKQNKYWQMSQILFRPDVTEEKDIISAARLIDIDIKKLKEDAHSDEVKQELSQSINESNERNVIGTPTLFIGFKQLTGVGTYPDFVEIIKQQGGIMKNKQNAK